MAKHITKSQLIGERGETAAKLRFLEIGFQFDARGRLEAGVDGIAEVMLDGQPLAKMIAVQVKATDAASYSDETDAGFNYLMRSDDLDYWRGTNLPIILVLYRIRDGSFYWKSIELGGGKEERRLWFDKSADILDEAARDKLAALCVVKSGQGHFVPPLRGGETAVINMIPVKLPDEIFVATSPHEHRKAMAILLDDRATARFDWTIHSGTYWSFHDPRVVSTKAIVDIDQVEAIDTEIIAGHEDDDQRNQFAFLLRLTLQAQFQGKLRWHRDKKIFYVPAEERNKPVSFPYQATVNKTSAEVVNVVRNKSTNEVSYVRHHAFVPRFEYLEGQWYIIITPTYYFTFDGIIPHSFPDGLLSGKKRLENNASLRGQIIMWHRYLTQDQLDADDMFAQREPRSIWPEYGDLPIVELPQTVPEDAWGTTLQASKAITEDAGGRLFDDT